MKTILTLTLIGLLLACGCSHSTTPQSTNPAWVDQLIAEFQSEPVGNQPQSIYRYDYKGQTVYYVPPQCCDQYSMLYNANGSVICAPDGGFTGHGDGKCADFFNESTNRTLVWSDNRSR